MGGGGHFHINLYGTCFLQGIIFQHKILNRVWKLIRNSETGYDYFLKNNRVLFSRTIDDCFPIVFGIFCNLIIPKQGIEMQIFFLKGFWRFLKNGHLPVKLHWSTSPPGVLMPACSQDMLILHGQQRGNLSTWLLTTFRTGWSTD